jgi:hypothetical protein
MCPPVPTGWINMSDVSEDEPDMLKEWFSEQEAAAAVHKSVRTLRKWRYQRVGPPYAFFGKTIRYHKPAFIEHFKQSQITPVRATNARRGR